MSNENNNVIIRNLTPHRVTIYDERCCEYDHNGRCYRLFSDPVILIDLPPENGMYPRCVSSEKRYDDINGIPVYGKVYGNIKDLPPFKKDIYLLVSSIVARTAIEVYDRKDVLVPCKKIRNKEGVIIGCIGLYRPSIGEDDDI